MRHSTDALGAAEGEVSSDGGSLRCRSSGAEMHQAGVVGLLLHLPVDTAVCCLVIMGSTVTIELSHVFRAPRYYFMDSVFSICARHFGTQMEFVLVISLSSPWWQ